MPGLYILMFIAQNLQIQIILSHLNLQTHYLIYQMSKLNAKRYQKNLTKPEVNQQCLIKVCYKEVLVYPQ